MDHESHGRVGQTARSAADGLVGSGADGRPAVGRNPAGLAHIASSRKCACNRADWNRLYTLVMVSVK